MNNCQTVSLASRRQSAAFAAATLSLGLFASNLAAQGNPFLLTYSQPETTLSGSNGTDLQYLQPNEIAKIGPCATPSAEKWAPRAVFHAMAGDENSDAQYWRTNLFGRIDALLDPVSTAPIGGTSPRTIFISPEVDVGMGVSAPLQLRAGDVGRFVRRTPPGDGQIEYFIRREQINQALGMPLATPCDVDAIAFVPSIGLFLSLDDDHNILTPCGPMTLNDGGVVFIPDTDLTYTGDFRIAGVTTASAYVLYSEADIDTMVVNAGVTNRFGTCLTQAIDLESLDLHFQGNGYTFIPCPGTTYQVPHLKFSVQTGSGASILTTFLGGSIYTNACGAYGSTCISGLPTFGPQTGIQQTSATVGAPSYVNSLTSSRAMRYALEIRTPVINNLPTGLPAGATLMDIGSPAPVNFVFFTFVPAGVNAVPVSAPGAPWSLLGFPDFYPTPFYYNFYPTVGGTSTFPSFAIPWWFTGKILFQAVGVPGMVEFSTPAILEIN
ncbi:MAG: hypothetical protein NXI31_12820 [bacterium]|nr:hypothetical protein [bacterium]